MVACLCSPARAWVAAHDVPLQRGYRPGSGGEIRHDERPKQRAPAPSPEWDGSAAQRADRRAARRHRGSGRAARGGHRAEPHHGRECPDRDRRRGASRSTPSDDVAKQIKGYASAVSVAKGATITLFVTVNPAQTSPRRSSGWGTTRAGGRLVRCLTTIVQRAARSHRPRSTRRPAWSLHAAGQRATSSTYPATWTSGVYLVKLTNSQRSRTTSPSSCATTSVHVDLLYQQSVTTYQAYNNYPERRARRVSLRCVPLTGQEPLRLQQLDGDDRPPAPRRAVKVSFDRPYSNDDGAGDFLDWELYFIRWIEQNGFRHRPTRPTSTRTRPYPSRLTQHRGIPVRGTRRVLVEGHVRRRDERAGRRGRARLLRREQRSTGRSGSNRTRDGGADRVRSVTRTPPRTRWSGRRRRSTGATWPLNRPEQQLLMGRHVRPASNPTAPPPAPLVVTNSSALGLRRHRRHRGTSDPRHRRVRVDRKSVARRCPRASRAATRCCRTPLSSSPRDDGSPPLTDHANAVIYQAASGAFVFNAASYRMELGALQLRRAHQRRSPDPADDGKHPGPPCLRRGPSPSLPSTGLNVSAATGIRNGRTCTCQRRRT